MKLYVLVSNDWNLHRGYDVAIKFVIRAKNEGTARLLASREAGEEGEDFWLNDDHTFCAPLEYEGVERVICRDFKAGYSTCEVAYSSYLEYQEEQKLQEEKDEEYLQQGNT